MYITIGNEEVLTNRPSDTWIYAAGIQDKSFQEQYLTAFYFSVTMLTTIGYGDIVPVSDQEKTLWIVMAIFGAVLYAAIFGTLSLIVLHS